MGAGVTYFVQDTAGVRAEYVLTTFTRGRYTAVTHSVRFGVTFR